jgi:hypothetical protein
MFLVIAFLVAASTPATPAKAPRSALTASAVRESEALIKKAIAHRQEGDDEAALKLLRQAYALAPTPRAAAQLGFAEQALGRWVDAETHVAEAVAAEKDPWVTKNRAAIVQALKVIRDHIARIEVIGEPTGAEVLVDGTSVGRLPLDGPVRVPADTIQVEVRATGHESYTERVTLAAAQYKRLAVKLRRLSLTPPPPDLTGTSPNTKPNTGGETSTTTLAAISPETTAGLSAEAPPPSRTKYWVIGGAAVAVAAGVAAIFLLRGDRGGGCPVPGADTCAGAP